MKLSSARQMLKEKILIIINKYRLRSLIRYEVILGLILIIIII